MRLKKKLIVLVLVVGCADADTVIERDQALELVEVLRIGDRLEGPATFTNIADVASASGFIAVLEQAPPRVAVFRDSGEWIGEIGREGDGPGELQRPSRVGVQGGKFWVGDSWAGRVEFFDPNGTSSESVRWRLDPEAGGVAQVPTAAFADGSVLAGPAPLGVVAADRGVTKRQDLARAPQRGSLLENLYSVPVDSADFFVSDRGAGGTPLMDMPLWEPFSRGLIVIERPEASGDSASYRVMAISLSGELAFDQDVSYLAIPAGDWVDEYMARLEQSMLERTGSIDRQTIRERADFVGRHRYLPPVTALVAGEDGSVWVRREDTYESTVSWDVFDSSGSRAGRVTTPADATIHAATLEEVWMEVKDELDVPYLLKMEVRKAAGAAP